MPAVGAWALARNRWRERSWRWIDVSAVALSVAAIAAAATHAAGMTHSIRLTMIALFVAIAVRIARNGTMRTLA